MTTVMSSAQSTVALGTNTEDAAAGVKEDDRVYLAMAKASTTSCVSPSPLMCLA